MTCGRDGCTGTIVDGYCDVCGMAARSEPAPSAATESILSGSATTQARRSVTSRSSGMVRGGLGAASSTCPPCPTATRRRRSWRTRRSPSPALLRPCDEPVGRGRDGAPGRTEGYCRKCGAPFSFAAKLARGRRGRRPVRGRAAASPTAGSAGSTSPATTTCPTVGGAQGPARHRRRRRDGRRARRAAVPGRGRAPEHRQDPQLRRARAAPATSSWSTSAARA